MKVLIVEDEIPAREELERILKKRFPHFEVAGALGSVAETVDWLNHNMADLIFMDIQLSDGDCFDIFGRVNVHTPVIFTTAYDQYALRAFKVNSIDYILKPITENELVAAVDKMEYRPESIRELVECFRPAPQYKARISVSYGDSYSFLPMSEVAYFISEDRLTFVVSGTGEKYAVDYTMESLEPLLDPKCFFRLSRGCIASINSIGNVSRYFNSRLKVSLRPKYAKDILVSRIRVPEFLKWLDGM